MEEPISTPPHTAHNLPQMTPIKIASLATTQPYTTHHTYRIDSCSAMGDEMKQYILGLMPVQVFLDEFLPLSGLSNFSAPTYMQGCYKATIGAKKEKRAYNPFVSSQCIFFCFGLPTSIM